MHEASSGKPEWNAYYQHHRDSPASSLLGTAIGLAGPQADRGSAVDLGCGTGNATRALLQAGWNVLAIDKEPGAIEMVRSIGEDFPGSTLETALQRFETLATLPPSRLIHAGMALPFLSLIHI